MSLASEARGDVVEPTVGDPAPRCAGCGAARSEAAWSALPLVERVAADRVRAFVVGWPEGACVEVRRCACGHALARKAARGA